MVMKRSGKNTEKSTGDSVGGNSLGVKRKSEAEGSREAKKIAKKILGANIRLLQIEKQLNNNMASSSKGMAKLRQEMSEQFLTRISKSNSNLVKGANTHDDGQQGIAANESNEKGGGNNKKDNKTTKSQRRRMRKKRTKQQKELKRADALLKKSDGDNPIKKRLESVWSMFGNNSSKQNTNSEQNKNVVENMVNGKPFRPKIPKQLSEGRFRWINEQLYTVTGTSAHQLFQENPLLFEEYHEGFRSVVEAWPVNPVDVLIRYLKGKSADIVVADLGCGEAKLAKAVPNKVLSFDLVANNDRVIGCDIAKLPVPDSFFDIAIFCLSLMGTNYIDYLKEAYRTLKTSGELKIAEVVSRFTDINAFIDAVKANQNKSVSSWTPDDVMSIAKLLAGRIAIDGAGDNFEGACSLTNISQGLSIFISKHPNICEIIDPIYIVADIGGQQMPAFQLNNYPPVGSPLPALAPLMGSNYIWVFNGANGTNRAHNLMSWIQARIQVCGASVVYLAVNGINVGKYVGIRALVDHAVNSALIKIIDNERKMKTTG
ncbi:187_t:CDS:2 [Ambispora gerdemannii]|uniref:Ribosomal RNA-processing protein 8 n=1 Tax=Ambispora gerdemannii TaxID=144530 RepID=A0A9N9BL20_9GLOM|nr:187_t:CDS:2 [Ambispora gerdemannii]